MKKLLRLNPEIVKYLWMEFSMGRLVIVPGLALLIAVLLLTKDDSIHSAASNLWSAGLIGFIALGMVWGMKSAADSILDEHNDRTWDWQRLSGISPLRLAVGKLFGSTVFNWYCALICVVVLLIASALQGKLGTGFEHLIHLVIAMLTLHSFMLILALNTIRRTDSRQKVKSVPLMISGFVALSILVRFGYDLLDEGILAGMDGTTSTTTQRWYGLYVSDAWYALISGVFYLLWMFAGVYRSLRAELRFSDLPTWWVAFLVSHFLLHLGLTGGGADYFNLGALPATGSSLMFMIMLMYVLALREPKDVMHWRSIIAELHKGNFNGALRIMPLWAVTLPLVAVFGLMAVIQFSTTGVWESISGLVELTVDQQSIHYLLAIFASVMGLMARDMIVIQYLGIAKFPKRTTLGAVIYLFLAYCVFPLLIPTFYLKTILLPIPVVPPLLLALAPWSLTVVAWLLLRSKWSAINSAVTK